MPELVVLPKYECVRLKLGVMPEEELSLRSVGLAQARKTASRMDGVKRESVRCESVRAAKGADFSVRTENVSRNRPPRIDSKFLEHLERFRVHRQRLVVDLQMDQTQPSQT